MFYHKILLSLFIIFACCFSVPSFSMLFYSFRPADLDDEQLADQTKYVHSYRSTAGNIIFVGTISDTGHDVEVTKKDNAITGVLLRNKTIVSKLSKSDAYRIYQKLKATQQSLSKKVNE